MLCYLKFGSSVLVSSIGNRLVDEELLEDATAHRVHIQFRHT